MAYKQIMHDEESTDASARERHVASNISSSLSGSGIGDDVADKKMNLLHAQGEPTLGRREPPPPGNPAKRRQVILGVVLGFIVIVAVIAIIIALGSTSNSLGGRG